MPVKDLRVFQPIRASGLKDPDANETSSPYPFDEY